MKERKKAQKEEEKRKKDRKQSAKFYITALDSTPAVGGLSSALNQPDPNDLTQEERERVIEILLGQDKVIAMLYDNSNKPSTGNPNIDIQTQNYQPSAQNQ
mmetsp:Transcript_6638/g.10669  ORF Transcript_6638/g.10669 Transcript_6638/m.10669 type:complete len:101 (+) Transcript_6638:1454-1756(+)